LDVNGNRPHVRVKIIVTADGLCPNQPFVDELKAANMSFILVAKTGKVTYQNNW